MIGAAVRLSVYFVGRSRVAEVLADGVHRNGDVITITGDAAILRQALAGCGLPGDCIPEREWSDTLRSAVAALELALIEAVTVDGVEYSRTGKAAVHRATGQASAEYANADDERVWRLADGSIVPE